MKIDDVSLTLFPWDNIPAARYSDRIVLGGKPSTLGLLTLKTSDGLEGHAFLGSALHPADLDAKTLIHALKPLLLSQDPLQRERLNQEMWRRRLRTTTRCIGAVDVALWDLAGKIAGLPVYRLLGACKEMVPAYCSSQMHDTAAEYVQQAQEFKARGFRAYKLHSSHPWEQAAAICRAVRESLGEDYPLMLDSVWSYSYDDALQLGRAVEALNFEWLEDPLPHYQIEQYAALCAKLSIPVMATEAPANGLTQYAPWILKRATDFLRGDVAMKGGITTLLKAAHLAEAFGMRYEVHMGANSLNDLANLHVVLAISNGHYFEMLQPTAVHQYALLNDIQVDSDGHVHAPSAPGLGAEIDFERIHRTKLAVLS